MAGADDQATLKVDVQVTGAASLGELEAAYRKAVADMEAATARGVAAMSEEMAALQTRVINTGEAYVVAGRAATKAMTEAAIATKEPAIAAAQLDAQLDQVEIKLFAVGKAGAVAGEGTAVAAAGAGSLLTGIGGLAIGIPVLIAIIKDVIFQVREWGTGLGELVVKIGELDHAQEELGSKTVPLKEAQERLAKAHNEVAVAAAALTLRNLEGRRSIEQILAAQIKYTEEQARAEKAYERATKEAKNQADIDLALAERDQALTKAKKELNEQIDLETIKHRELSAAMNEQGERRQALVEKILGNTLALTKEKDELLLVIGQVEQHGKITEEVSANISEALTGLLEKYAKFGKDVPLDLQLAIDKYGQLGEVHKKLVEQVAKGPSGSGEDPTAGLRKHAEELNKTIDELNKQQLEGGLDATGLSKLTQAQDDLARTNQDLHNATLDATKAIVDQGEAARAAMTPLEQGASVLQHYADSGMVIPGAFTGAAKSIGEVAQETRDARDAMTETASAAATMKDEGSAAAEELAKQWLAAGESGAKLEDQSDQTKAAIDGLAERQGGAAKTTKQLHEETETLAKTLRSVGDHVAELNGDGNRSLLKMTNLLHGIVELVKQAEGSL